MPRVKLILNPIADHGHAGENRDTLQATVEEQARIASQAEHSYELSWVGTEQPGHATRLAQAAVSEGYDMVVAVGGDGTSHEVVNGLMQIEPERRPLFGVVPVGSGNDFAFNLGISADPGKAARRIFSGKAHQVDIGLVVDGTGRQEYWDNTLGIGFSGVVNIATRKRTRLRGFMVYLVSVLETILFRPPALRARIQIDDGPVEERWLSMISICNGPREGGGFPVAPHAVMDDGLISYTYMRRLNRLQMLFFLPIVMSAKHLSFPRFFEAGTGKQFRIETDQTMAIHADGEVFGPWEANIRQIEVSIIPAALEVLC